MLEHQMTADPHWIDKQVLAEGFKPQETTSAKRCVIREIDLNRLDKAEVVQLNDLIDAFSAQEEYFLRLLESKKFRRYGGLECGFRDLRNAIVRGQIPIEMRHGLQARHWKLALDCACQTATAQASRDGFVFDGTVGLTSGRMTLQLSAAAEVFENGSNNTEATLSLGWQF